MSFVGFQPVTGKLFVEGWLTVSWFVAFCRPEAGAVRSEHFITKNNVAFLVKTKFKFCIGNDNAAAEGIFSTFIV